MTNTIAWKYGKLHNVILQVTAGHSSARHMYNDKSKRYCRHIIASHNITTNSLAYWQKVWHHHATCNHVTHNHAKHQHMTPRGTPTEPLSQNASFIPSWVRVSRASMPVQQSACHQGRVVTVQLCKAITGTTAIPLVGAIDGKCCGINDITIIKGKLQSFVDISAVIRIQVTICE